MKACFAAQMREMDSDAVHIGKIPSIILMENAALACADELEKDLCGTSGKRIVIFCGKGNNGGDGLAMARHLHSRGAEIMVFLVSGNEFSGDALINYEIAAGLDISVETVTDTENLKYIIRSADAVVDAIYGTGIHGTVYGIGSDVIEEINANARYVLSVDIPSGINADSGEICGICIKADKTVTFAAYKIGMLMFPGADYTGKIVTADISMPKYISEADKFTVNVTDTEFVKKHFPRRENNSHKGDYGKLLIIAGSRGMSGAAYMAAQSALKAGCGLVTLGICESLNPVMETKTTEVMTMPLPESNGHLSSAAAGTVRSVLDKYDAVLIGPGLGRSADVSETVRTVLLNSKSTVIVDADAINIISKNKEILSECSCNLIFTPHAMEMSRLTGLDIAYIEENRLTVSREFAEEYGATIILKGHHTVVTAPNLTQYINITGNSGLAKGGSGDVLAGITAAFAARGMDDGIAAACAVCVHGTAADKAAAVTGRDAMTASDVTAHIAAVLKEITEQ